MANRTYVQFVSAHIVVETTIALGSSTTHTIKVKKPSGATATWLASVVNATQLEYWTVANDLDEAGTYLLQAYVVIPGTHAIAGLGSTVALEVLNAFT